LNPQPKVDDRIEIRLPVFKAGQILIE